MKHIRVKSAQKITKHVSRGGIKLSFMPCNESIVFKYNWDILDQIYEMVYHIQISSETLYAFFSLPMAPVFPLTKSNST